jgi:hypothetical protein
VPPVAKVKLNYQILPPDGGAFKVKDGEEKHGNCSPLRTTSPTGIMSCDSNVGIFLVAEPNSGFAFVRWEVGTLPSQTDKSSYFLLGATDIPVKVIFMKQSPTPTPTPTPVKVNLDYEISPPDGGKFKVKGGNCLPAETTSGKGVIYCDPNTTINLEPEPNAAKFVFSNWEINGLASQTVNDIKVQLGVNIKAIFKLK